MHSSVSLQIVSEQFLKAKKPAGWLDDGPEKIPDPEAKKPEDWDDEEVREAHYYYVNFLKLV